MAPNPLNHFHYTTRHKTLPNKYGWHCYTFNAAVAQYYMAMRDADGSIPWDIVMVCDNGTEIILDAKTGAAKGQ